MTTPAETIAVYALLAGLAAFLVGGYAVMVARLARWMKGARQ
jgi:hypothetical protein